MNTSLQDKVALVTGGTSGIGKAAALALAVAGAKVVVAGRRENEGREVVEAIEKLGGKALFVKTDITKEADVKALVDKAVKAFGRLDIATPRRLLARVPSMVASLRSAGTGLGRCWSPLGCWLQGC